MKKSQFVFEIKKAEGLLLYNTYNGGLLLLDEDDFHEYSLAISGTPCVESPLIKQLIKDEFLVDENLDEYNALLRKNWQARNQEEYLRFDVAPTTKCNFACTYCFEHGIVGNTMSLQVCDDVADFIYRKGKNASKIDLIWYGGEPLCAIPQIKRISEKLLENHTFASKISAKMITNGYALSDKIVEELVSYHVDLMQITVDGPRHAHDAKRILRNGLGTFDQITKNLQKYAGIIDVAVKINVDRLNKDYLPDLLDDWDAAGLKNTISISLSRIISTSNMLPPEILTVEEFAQVEVDFYKMAIEKGYDSLYLPKASLGYCDGTGRNYLINSDGSLFLCLEEIGHSQNNVGSIYKGYTDNEIYDYFIKTVDFGKTECRNCAVLPICLGGCPMKKFRNGSCECAPIKFNAEKLVEIWYDSHTSPKRL